MKYRNGESSQQLKNIHDSKILNYQVDFEDRKVEIKLLSEQDERARILFGDFFAFYFEDQLPDSIILDIVESEIDLFVAENKDLLNERKDYSWPMDYDHESELMNYIKENDYKYYIIQASYGLNGWVLSKKVIMN